MRTSLKLTLWLCIGLGAISCGRKEPPQVIGEGPPPAIAEMTHEIEGNILVLNLRLQGGADGIGYQVDRTEIDPYCKCPGFWRRFFDRPPAPELAGRLLQKNINLKTTVEEYVFRIRAVDGLGRLGPWSKPFRAQAEPFK